MLKRKLYLVIFLLPIFTNSEMINGTSLQSEHDSSTDSQDCEVHQTYSLENWLGNPLSFMAFIEHGESLSTIIGFQGQHMDLVYDKIIMSQDEITVCKIRNGDINETNFNEYLDTAGWIWIEISMNNQEFILKYNNITAFEYIVDQPVKELVIHGSYITICKEGSPTWILEPKQSAVIPLEPSRQAVNPFIKKTHALTFRSGDDFTPCILIGGDKTCFGLDNDSITASSTTKAAPLPAGKLDLHLDLVAGFLNIYQKANGAKHYVTRFPKEQMKFIEVTSNYSKFSVSLNVYVHPNSSSEVACTDCEQIQIRLPNDTSFNNGLLIGILIGVATAFTVLIIGYLIIKKQMFALPWKKSKIDEANENSTNQSSENTLEETNQLV